MRMLLALAVSLFALSAGSVIETYEFENEQQRQRYHRFVEELRCPKCQNQNLAGSDAPIAADLREQLHRLIVTGHSDAEIRQFMVERYGDFILYRPRFTAETLLLWLSPALLLLVGGAIWWFQLRRRGQGDALDAPALSEEEQRRVDRLLAEGRGGQRDD